MSGAFEILGTGSRAKPARISAAVIELAAMASFLALAIVDVLLPYVNVSILFAAPFLIAIGVAKSRQRVWALVAVFITCVYLVYAIKYSAIRGQSVAELLSFRLLNRTFVVITLALLGLCATTWRYWQYERSLLDLGEKREEDEVNATAGMIGCVGIGLILAAADLLAPAKLNVPILLLVPLYLASWQECRWSLWGTAAAMIALTWLGYFFSLAPSDEGITHQLTINRLIASAAILIAAAIFHWRMRRRAVCGASR